MIRSLVGSEKSLPTMPSRARGRDSAFTAPFSHVNCQCTRAAHSACIATVGRDATAYAFGFVLVAPGPRRLRRTGVPRIPNRAASCQQGRKPLLVHWTA